MRRPLRLRLEIMHQRCPQVHASQSVPTQFLAGARKRYGFASLSFFFMCIGVWVPGGQLGVTLIARMSPVLCVHGWT
jgi:hypothetical protein